MSSGKVHTTASLMLTGTLCATGLLNGNIALIWSATGALCGVMLTPDLDVDSGTIHNQYIRSNMGVFASKIWDGLWYFYRKSLKHGGPLSHFPVISTLGRVLYLYFFLIVLPTYLLSWIAPLNVSSELAWWTAKFANLQPVLIGLMGSDFIHWGLDVLTTEHKKNGKTQKPPTQNGKPNPRPVQNPVLRDGNPAPVPEFPEGVGTRLW